MKLIDNARRAWRLLSIQVAAFFAVWGLVPPEQQKAVLGLVSMDPAHVPAVAGVMFILARLVRQPKALDPEGK